MNKKKHITIWELMSDEHKHKINETKKRSLFKGISMRILEVIVDTTLLSVLGLDVHVSLTVSVAIEGICFAVHYVNERMWNKINWGREIIDIEK